MQYEYYMYITDIIIFILDITTAENLTESLVSEGLVEVRRGGIRANE